VAAGAAVVAAGAAVVAAGAAVVAAGAAVVAAGAAGPPSSLLPQAPASSANVATRAVNQRSRVLMDLFPSIEPHSAALSETNVDTLSRPADPTRDLTVCQVSRSLPITSA